MIRSMDYLAKKMQEDPALRDKAGSIRLFLAGGSGNREEYAGIRKIAERSPIPVDFLGRLPQKSWRTDIGNLMCLSCLPLVRGCLLL